MFGIGNQPPFYNNGFWAGGTVPNPSTFNAAVTFKDTVTINKTAEAGAETNILTVKVSDDATANILLRNNSSSIGTFSPRWLTTGPNTNAEYIVINDYLAGGSVDSGSLPLTLTRFGIGSLSTAASTRTLWRVQNGNNTILDYLPLNSGANLALSWGTQAGSVPSSLATRPVGTRLITYAAWNASTLMDYAIGTDNTNGHQWYGIPAATSSYSHRFYAGTSLVAHIRGDGYFATTGGEVKKVRVATSSPVTCASGTDRYVITKLTVPGAVAVTLPTGVTGQEVTIIDGTGDAGANNITVSPASGTINGAATYVINANYGKATFVYDGTQWLVAG